MFEPVNLESLLKIFYFGKKRDLVRHCKSATIHASDFASLIIASEAGVLPWHHRIHYRDFVPIHLRPTDEEFSEFAKPNQEKLEGKAAKVVSKISQIFEERRYVVGHMFHNSDFSDWHFFYFDQRDMDPDNSHWAQGAHVHLINKLWPNQDAQSLWSEFTSGNIKLSGSIHIRYERKKASGT